MTRTLALGFVLSFACWVAGVVLCVWALHTLGRQRSRRDHLAFAGVVVSGLSMFVTYGILTTR